VEGQLLREARVGAPPDAVGIIRAGERLRAGVDVGVAIAQDDDRRRAACCRRRMNRPDFHGLQRPIQVEERCDVAAAPD